MRTKPRSWPTVEARRWISFSLSFPRCRASLWGQLRPTWRPAPGHGPSGHVRSEPAGVNGTSRRTRTTLTRRRASLTSAIAWPDHPLPGRVRARQAPRGMASTTAQAHEQGAARPSPARPPLKLTGAVRTGWRVEHRLALKLARAGQVSAVPVSYRGHDLRGEAGQLDIGSQVRDRRLRPCLRA